MKGGGVIAIVLALAVLGVWAAYGFHLATLTKKPVVERTVDDFGDTVETTRWEDTFEPGLDIAGPAGGGLLGLGGLLLMIARKRARQNA